jgi:DME family drug/metabolite transporter
MRISARGAAVLAVGSAAMLFGTSATVARRHAPGLDALSVAAWRLIVGGSALVLLAHLLGRAPWRYPVRPGVVLLGALTVVGFQAGFFAAVARLGVGQATVLAIAAGPVAAGLLDHVRGQARLTRRWAAGVAVVVAGIALLGSGGWSADPVGWAMAIAAGCGFPVYGAALRDLGRDRPPLAAVATIFGAAVPLVAALALAGGVAVPGTDALLGVAWLGLAATAVAYLLWTRGLATLTVRDTMLLTTLEPVTAVLLAALVLGEPLGLAGLVGIAAVVGGTTWAAAGPGHAPVPVGSPGRIGLGRTAAG